MTGTETPFIIIRKSISQYCRNVNFIGNYGKEKVSHYKQRIVEVF